MYSEFFRLCGFEAEELDKERSRIDKAFKLAGIGVEDVVRAEERVKKYFDTELLGVRQALKIWLRRLIDLVLAREEGKKIIVYPSWPPEPRVVSTVAMASEEVFCETPEIVMDVVMGQIFGKLNPILEAGEEHGLPPGLGMCSLNQARLGGIAKGIVPIPDITMTTSFLCDQTPKTDELLHEIYGVRNIFIDNCMDAPWEEPMESPPHCISYFAPEISRAIQEFEDSTGVRLSDEQLRDARIAYAKPVYVYQEILSLMKGADPQPISQVDLGLLYWLIQAPERRSLEEGLAVANAFARDIKDRIDAGYGVVEKGAPKIAWFLHHATDPTVMHMVEDLGLAIPVVAVLWIPPWLKERSRFTTFAERVADQTVRMGINRNTMGAVRLFQECCKEFNVDGLLYLYLFSCRPICLTALMVKKGVEDELGIPVLALEGDVWDTRDYSTEALKTRVETFAEMLRAAKTARVSQSM
jgi:benzoyl-CoA reductase/2-hydroxyglutaryl-CoA dehydratase subunit BcrC/BadD/HgdB